MTESFWLVIAGGLVAVVASLVPILLQRSWDVRDRRRAVDAKALEAAVDKLVAWHGYAGNALSGEIASADERRLAELDASWEANFALIPDQEATRELIDSYRDIYFFAGSLREAPDAMQRHARLIKLQDRVIDSALRKRRELA